MTICCISLYPVDALHEMYTLILGITEAHARQDGRGKEEIQVSLNDPICYLSTSLEAEPMEAERLPIQC